MKIKPLQNETEIFHEKTTVFIFLTLIFMNTLKLVAYEYNSFFRTCTLSEFSVLQ